MAQANAGGQDTTGSLDPAEVAKFERDAEEWWDGSGKFRPLHVLNPTRIAIIKSAVAAHFDCDAKSIRTLDGQTLLDVGCGGGLVSEPMCRLGAKVTGADPGEANIAVARSHAERLGLDIEYLISTAEAVRETGRQFDVVLGLEIVEHTSDPFGFVAVLADLVKPGGLLVMSTINRTLAALALAKFGAEYVLRWVPKGTHEFRRFVTVRELRLAMESAGLNPHPPAGMSYRPLKDEWKRSFDTSVNYIMWAEKAL
jgi:2-polyprenyl-6-hydroxyphenyl methylase/3-demethylubiquinone-9 3-methyltransferase